MQSRPQHAELPGGNMPPMAPHQAQYFSEVEPQYQHPTGAPYGQSHQTSDPVYEDVHADVGGARSPTGSERSNFTSISQRGVNPRWNPNYNPNHPPMPQMQARRANQRQDVLLDNPDFQLPSSSAARPRGTGPGMIPGSAYPTGPV